MVEYTSPFLAECSLAVWSSVRSKFKNGILFLSSDLAEAVARCPGSQALHDLGAACLLSFDDPPAALRATANTFPRNGRLNVCFAINTLLSDASDAIVEIVQALPCHCVITILTTVSSIAHESSARTTLEADAYDYIASIWEEMFASHGCPGHDVSVQYFPMHVTVVGGIGFQLLLSDTACKAVQKDVVASTTNDITYARQVLSTAEHGVGSEDSVHELEVIAHALAGLRANLSIRPTWFAAGPVARKVAQLVHGLPTWPQPLAGTSTHAAAVVLVDRATDLSTAMMVPHTLVGLAGSADGLALSNAKAGNIAAAWWQAAAGKDDGFAAAEMALQDALPNIASHTELFPENSDLDSSFRSGTITEWSPFVAHAARQCIALQEAALDHTSQDDSVPPGILDGISVEAASFTRAFSKLVESPCSPENAPNTPASILFVSMRALVIGLAALVRQGGGAGHMDPVDAFLSMYGARIYDALARAVDREAAAAKCSVHAYIATLQCEPCHTTAMQPSAPLATSSVYGVPVAEADGLMCTSQMLYCDSMSIHSSDADVSHLDGPFTSSPLPGFYSSPQDLHAGAAQPVAEATEWTGGWEDDWEEPPRRHGACDATIEWASEAWGDASGWMDAPEPTLQTSLAAEDETSERTQSAEGPNATVLPAGELGTSTPPAAERGAQEADAGGRPVTDQPKKVVKKKIIKKVVKKVIKRKIRTGAQPAKAAETTSKTTADERDSSLSTLAAQSPAADADAVADANAETLLLEPDSVSMSGAVPELAPGDESPLHQVQLTEVTCPQVRSELQHEDALPHEAGQQIQNAKQQGSCFVVDTSENLASTLRTDGPDEGSRVNSIADTSQSVAYDISAAALAVAGQGQQSKPATPQAAKTSAADEAHDTHVSTTAVLVDADSAGRGYDHVPSVLPEGAGVAYADTREEPDKGRLCPDAPAVPNTDAWSDESGWGDAADSWDEERHDVAADVVQQAGMKSAVAVPHAECSLGKETSCGSDVSQPVVLAILHGTMQTPTSQAATEAKDSRNDVNAIASIDQDDQLDARPESEVHALSSEAPVRGISSGTVYESSAPPCGQDAGSPGEVTNAAWEEHEGPWGSEGDGWGEDDAGWQNVGWAGEHAGLEQASAGGHGVWPSEEHDIHNRPQVEGMEDVAAGASPDWTPEKVHHAGIDRAWADRAAAASDSSPWTGAWFVKGLESIASKVEAVVMSPATTDGADGSSDFPPRPTLGQAGHTGSWGPEQWEGWGSRLSTPQRPLRLAREIGSTASLPDGPADAMLQVAEAGQMPGVAEETEEGASHPPGGKEMLECNAVLGSAHAAAAFKEVATDGSGWNGQGGAPAEVPEGHAGCMADGQLESGDGKSEAVHGDSGAGAKLAATLAVVAEDQELGASGGLVDGPVQAVPNATVLAEVSASSLQHPDRGWGDSWSDATTLGTHADACMLTEDASMLTAGPDAASVSADPCDAAGASPGGSPPESRADTDVGSVEVPSRSTGAQGLSALAVHMHDAEASYVDATGTSARGTSEEASRPDWSVVSTLGTDAVAAGLHTEEPALGSTPLEETRQGAGGLAAAVRGTAGRGVDLKQVGKELGWSIASTGDSAGGREAGAAGASGAPERTASPRKRLQEVVAEDVIDTRELHDAAERLLEAGWGDGWSDAATLGTLAEIEAAVLGSGAGDGPAGEGGADLQIVDEEGDAGGWGAGWGEDGGETGERQAQRDGGGKPPEEDAAANNELQADQLEGDGDNGWSGWGAWDEGTAGAQSDATEAVPAPHREGSPEAKAFAQAIVRIACRCARAAGPPAGIVNAVVRAVKGEPLDAQLGGVTHVKGAVGSMLSHGLGALGLGSADPRLSEFSRVIIFVLGGVTMEELGNVSQAAQPASGAKTAEIVLGGMHVTTAEELAALLIKTV